MLGNEGCQWISRSFCIRKVNFLSLISKYLLEVMFHFTDVINLNFKISHKKARLLLSAFVLIIICIFQPVKGYCAPPSVPIPVEPDGDTISVDNVDLEWTYSTGTAEYIWQILTLTDSLYKSGSTPSTSISVLDMADGDFKWRVSACNSSYECSNWSNEIYGYNYFTIELTAPEPDLTADINALNEPWTWGDSVGVEYEVSNIGSGNAGSFFLDLVYSNDSNIGDSDDVLIERIPVSGLNSGATWGQSYAFTLPTSPPAGMPEDGSVYIGIFADSTDSVDEKYEDNNTDRDGVSMSMPNTPPTISLMNPSSNLNVSQGDPVTLTWIDSDPDDNASISLYYDSDCSQGGETGIVFGIQEDPDGSSDQYIWNTTDVPAGTHRIWGMIYDGTNPAEYSCAPGAVTIDINHDPVLSGGDVVPYIGGPDQIFSYLVRYEDEDGDLPSTRQVFIDGTPHDMEISFGSDPIVGMWYDFEISGSELGEGLHNCFFYFEDGNGGSAIFPDGAAIQKPEMVIMPGEIHGGKWNDLNGDRQWDANEPGLQGWVVYIDENANGRRDASEPFKVTDENGAYAFIDLQPGSYIISEEMQAGWIQTFPGTGAAILESSSMKAPKSPPIVTTAGSIAPMHAQGWSFQALDMHAQTNQSFPLINLNEFRNDSRFSEINGEGLSVVILDTGIDLDHPYFGPDNDQDGVADRIVFNQDFTSAGDPNAQDMDGHGSNVSGVIASEHSMWTGICPGVDIIHLQVLNDSGTGNFGWMEQALQWTLTNHEIFNIRAVNVSISDENNWAEAASRYGVGDELANLAAENIIVVSSAGNHFNSHNSSQGVGYPAGDPNSLAISAVYDSGPAGHLYESDDNAEAFSSDADRITPFTQRHQTLTDVFAPGAPITNANHIGGNSTYHGTSQAAPHITGIVVLAQQLAERQLGRRLTIAEFRQLLENTGVTINDGDDEDDNVTNTGLDFQRIDVMALMESILAMGDQHVVNLQSGQIIEDINFGNMVCESPEIMDGPHGVTVDEGQDVSFAVSATGTGPLNYQWKKDGVIVGGDSPALTLANVQLSDDGSAIICEISNACGQQVTSETAILNVLPSDYCHADFNQDKDVDGNDLASFISNAQGIGLEDFASSFGKTDCP